MSKSNRELFFSPASKKSSFRAMQDEKNRSLIEDLTSDELSLDDMLALIAKTRVTQFNAASPGGVDGSTVLHRIICENFANKKLVVKTILERGVELNHQNTFGDSALILMALHNDLDMIKLLVDAGADLNLSTCSGRTATSILEEYRAPDYMFKPMCYQKNNDPNDAIAVIAEKQAEQQLTPQ